MNNIIIDTMIMITMLTSTITMVTSAIITQNAIVFRSGTRSPLLTINFHNV